MQGVKESRLGKALIVLGLEDQFLLNGELQRFPLVQRGALANEIIDEKLKLGKWRGVVNMIFGGFGKADALYEGNIEQLRERIASTAAISGKEEISAETITTLAKKGEYELILRIIESHPKVSLKDLESLRSKIPTAFFEEENKWQQRTRRLDELAAAKAMSEGNYYSALHYFQELKDTQRIQQASDFVLKKGDINYHVAEQIALSDPRQKDSRLRKIVLSHTRQKGLNPVDAFKIFKKYNVKLSRKEQEALYEAAAEKVAVYEIKKTPEISQDHKLLLLWAKKHATEEPRAAFNIFNLKTYQGAEVVQAARASLEDKGWKDYEKARVLNVEEIPEQTLRKVYREAPFKVRVKIATHLKDSGLLKTLSKQAANRNNYREAYDLWLSSGAGMDSKYLIKLKRALIEDGIKKDNGYIFLDESDRIGNLMAFEALMQASQQSSNFLPRAYETARKIRDETLTQRARKAIVDISPRLALRMFKGFEKEKVEDPAGVDYVLSVVAQNTGSNPTLLKELVGKYSPE